MAYKVNASECINCATCERECPVGGISEVDSHRFIDEKVCIDCSTCADVCPVGCHEYLLSPFMDF